MDDAEAKIKFEEIVETYTKKINTPRKSGASNYTYVLIACQKAFELGVLQMRETTAGVLRELEQEIVDGLITPNELHRLVSDISKIIEEGKAELPPTDLERIFGRRALDPDEAHDIRHG